MEVEPAHLNKLHIFERYNKQVSANRKLHERTRDADNINERAINLNLYRFKTSQNTTQHIAMETLHWRRSLQFKVNNMDRSYLSIGEKAANLKENHFNPMSVIIDQEEISHVSNLSRLKIHQKS